MAKESARMRWGEPADAQRIADYHYQCWQTAFASLVSAEVMEFIEPRVDIWKQRLALNSGITTVVAVDSDDRPIGHTTVADNELMHLSIDPEHHRRGIGRQLLEVGERLIRRTGQVD